MNCETPEPDGVPILDGELANQIEIKAPFEKVARTLADIANWPDWIAGLETTLLDKSQPIKVGHHHICVFPDQPLSITVEQITQKEDEFALVENISPPRPLKKLLSVFRANAGNGSVTVRHSYSYTRKKIVGRLFDLKSAGPMKMQSMMSLEKLKEMLES